MRVTAVEIINHPGLGSFNIDFRGANGTPAKTVILAGENGCGKTAVLEAIFAALAPTNLLLNLPRRLPSGRYRVLVEPDEHNNLNSLPSPINPELYQEVRTKYPDFDGAVIEVDGNRSDNNYAFCQYSSLRDNTALVHNQVSDQVLNSKYCCFYSEANISFDVPRIESISALAGQETRTNIPPQIAYPVRGGARLAHEIAQLLIDLKSADDAEVARWLVQNSDGRPPDDVLNRRISRFSNAFSNLAPHKSFVGIETIDGEHRAIFEEHGFRTPLANLSTGEKQIVFRGAFLLRSYDEIPGAVVLIDEPELSLHPTWQSNILNFYEEIVREEEGRNSQIIIATHSPFVVHGSPAAKHIIMKRNRPSGMLEVNPEGRYSFASPRETAIAAFDLEDFKISAANKRLALVVEGPTDKDIIETCWQKRRPHQQMPFVIISAGGARGIQQLIGSDPNQPSPIMSALAHTDVDRVLGLFDFDAEGYGQWNGTIKKSHCDDYSEDVTTCAWRKRASRLIFASLLPVPAQRGTYASLDPDLASQSRLTIELLFKDEDVRPLLSEVPLLGASGLTCLRANNETQKQAVAAAAKDFASASFCGFENLLALVQSILQM